MNSSGNILIQNKFEQNKLEKPENKALKLDSSTKTVAMENWPKLVSQTSIPQKNLKSSQENNCPIIRKGTLSVDNKNRNQVAIIKSQKQESSTGISILSKGKKIDQWNIRKFFYKQKSLR